MSFVREGIDHVRAEVLPDGVTLDGWGAVVARAALVRWHSSLTGMCHQVYLNGRFAGATIDAEQRQLLVQVPASFATAVHVEVIGVAPQDAHLDFADALEPLVADSGRVQLKILRSQTLPLDATANIYCDNGTGVIDYATPLNRSPIPIWPCRQDKAGFGMAQFGAGDFAFDAAAAVGLGRGSFGLGLFGLDADTFEWISPLMSQGEYRFGVRIVDAQGHEGPARETDSIAVPPGTCPPL